LRRHVPGPEPREDHLARDPPVPAGFVNRIAAARGSVTFGDGGAAAPQSVGRLASLLRGIVTHAERRGDGRPAG
jgi:hypothetical protein